jgi:tRNA U34 5-methylaminomethyl-2-thiouridine-forming methyltransferase MnmC
VKREIITTKDGSVTIHLPELNESYHSKNGAIPEAYHVYIKNGLDHFNGQPVSVLEVGFGTGLNAFITFLEAAGNSQPVHYTGVEAYPVTPEEVTQLNYAEMLDAKGQEHIFSEMHTAGWGTAINLGNNFTLVKRQQRFEEINDVEAFDLIYFDAFGYPTQPELWTLEIFQAMYASLKKGGVLVTYACRGIIKRNMTEAGFTTSKLPGPPGKWEMLRGIKY